MKKDCEIVVHGNKQTLLIELFFSILLTFKIF